jgi:diguanylate cyclase (GGDEF)-like protein/PAS domain S-box-containing protein
MRPLNILLADDCTMTTEVIGEQLRALGHTVTVVDSGEAAVEIYRSSPIELVLMDLDMPGQGGLAAIRAIREMTPGRWTPILVITAKLDFEDIHESFLAGADDYINKPVRPSHLEIRIHQMMRIAALQRRSMAVIDHVIEGIIQIDRSGIIHLFNQAAERIFGYTEAEVIGQNVRMLMPSPHQEAHDQYLGHHLNTGESRIIGRGREVQGRRKNGEIFPLHLGVTEVETPDDRFFVGLIRDLSVEQQLRSQLLESQRFLADLIENSAAATFVKDCQGRYRLVNKKYEEITGRSRDDVLGQTDAELSAVGERHLSSAADEAVMRSGQVIEDHESLDFEDGPRHYLSVRFPTRDSHGEINGLCGMATDVSELKRTQEQLERLSQYDDLTGLFNRRHFLALARNEIYRSSRYRGGLAALMLDIDHFKQINDQYGHQAGDAVLRTAGVLIRDSLRNHDIAGRLGGEEFAILLTDTSGEGAAAAAERLRSRFAAQAFDIGTSEPLRCTLSIGVAHLHATHSGIEALLHEADQGLYRAKHNGRNRVCRHPG